ncbi:hypothetical protein Vretimale_4454 [Volvox reticuliferus]|uniref:Uncharacterized protein n=1 Tax=Volvox reticuliferus TaxID=1737510 RepID=A0A8J4G501_9CHLO|nr:hypothetical protein Vretifemale_3035 [Volvox reticuliferus]GIL99223.1 hypothetical protein Vretimale_4454 [Volvox reticuliferus]
MGLIPVLLGAVSKPLEITYKVTRLVLRLKGTHKVLGVADHLATFTLDLMGKVKLSLTLLLVKLVHGKVRCQKLAAHTCKWLDEHRGGPSAGDSNECLLEDLNNLFSKDKEAVIATAMPLTRAGLLFLRDCLEPLHPGDKDICARFMKPDGRLDLNAALTAFYGTETAYKLADALSAQSGSLNADSLMLKVYNDVRYALRRDLTEMLIL